MRWMMIAIALALAPHVASAQGVPRPEVFYVIGRAAPPRVPRDRLPPAARAPYARRLELARAIRELAERPRTDATRAELARLDEALAGAEAQLAAALERERSALSAEGWRVLGEARIDRIGRALLDAWDEADPSAPEPSADYGPAIDALSRAAALSEGEAGAWARYLEAWCWLEMSRGERAGAALHIVAASGPSALRAEARFRLGDLAYERGALAEAAAWYGRVASDPAARFRDLAIYRLAWSRHLAGDHAGAILAIDRLPSDAAPEIRADLEQLRALAVP